MDFWMSCRECGFGDRISLVAAAVSGGDREVPTRLRVELVSFLLTKPTKTRGFVTAVETRRCGTGKPAIPHH